MDIGKIFSETDSCPKRDLQCNSIENSIDIQLNGAPLRELLHAAGDVAVLVLADLGGAVALGVQVHAVHRVLDQLAHDPLQQGRETRDRNESHFKKLDTRIFTM